MAEASPCFTRTAASMVRVIPAIICPFTHITYVIAPLVQDVLAVTQHNFRSMQGISIEDIVLLPVIPSLENMAWLKFRRKLGQCSRRNWSPSRRLSNLVRSSLIFSYQAMTTTWQWTLTGNLSIPPRNATLEQM